MQVPGLYRPEELDALLPALKDRAMEAGWRDSLFGFFAHRVRQNLHVALLLDSAAPAFVPTCEANPALYSRCALHWLPEWRAESMLQVPQIVLGADLVAALTQHDQSLVRKLGVIHDRAGAFGGTPRHYLVLIQTFVEHVS
jgi:dynein heavy chain 2